MPMSSDPKPTPNTVEISQCSCHTTYSSVATCADLLTDNAPAHKGTFPLDHETHPKVESVQQLAVGWWKPMQEKEDEKVPSILLTKGEERQEILIKRLHEPNEDTLVEGLSKTELSNCRAALESMLGTTVRIEMCDGRIMQGRFLAVDRARNCVLGQTEEFRNDFNASRYAGLVVVPGRHLKRLLTLSIL